MKNTSNTMYNIGRIFTIVELVLGPILFLIGLICVIVGYVVDPQDAPLISSGGSLIGWGIYFIVVSILALVFVGKAKRELADEQTKNPSPFIVTIVFGAIASNPFYVIAGIFGLVAENQQGQPAEEAKEEPKEVEEPKEEPKE